MNIQHMIKIFKKVSKWLPLHTMTLNRSNATDLTEFWKSDNLQNIIPKGTPNPEGWDVADFLSTLDIINNSTSSVEIGCGYGRLSRAFDPSKHLGVDINPQAIEEAKKRNPEYQYRLISYHDQYPSADLGMAYTVLLHVSDDLIEGVVKNISDAYQKFIVAEILGRTWRNPSQKVPVFNREKQDYQELFLKYGMKLTKSVEKEYVHYPNTNITFLVFER